MTLPPLGKPDVLNGWYLREGGNGQKPTSRESRGCNQNENWRTRGVQNGKIKSNTLFEWPFAEHWFIPPLLPFNKVDWSKTQRMSIKVKSFRIHLAKMTGLPEGGGCRKTDICCYSNQNSIVKLEQTVEGRSKNPDFHQTSLMVDGPNN